MSAPTELLPIEADPVVGPLIDAFTACVCAEIQAAQPARGVCKCGLVAGFQRPPADFCNCGNGGCGQAWVRLGDETPVGAVETGRRRRCDVQKRRIEIEVGIYRCQAVHGPKGEPPSYERRTADAYGSIADLYILRKAVFCCQALVPYNVQFVESQRLAVEGQCGGVQMTFTIDV